MVHEKRRDFKCDDCGKMFQDKLLNCFSLPRSKLFASSTLPSDGHNHDILYFFMTIF